MTSTGRNRAGSARESSRKPNDSRDTAAVLAVPLPPEFDADGVEIIRTSHGVVPSQLIRSAPCWIRWFVMWAYCELLRPDDDFRQELRKIVLVFGPLCTGVSASVLVVNWLTLGDNWTFPAIAARTNSLIVITTWWATYLTCRFTGRASALVTDIWVFGTWFGLFLVAVTYHDYPIDQSFVLVLIIAMLGRTPRLPVHAFLCLLAVAVASYNNAVYARGDPELTLLGDPSSIMRGVGIRLFFTALSFGSIVIVLAGLQLQLLESDRQTTQATASSEVAQELARLLGGYRTQDAVALIEEAQLDRCASADPALLACFKVLVNNLEQYRPHLPNWMLTHGSSEDDADLNHSPDAEERSTVVSLHSGRNNASTTRSTRSVASRASTKRSSHRGAAGDAQPTAAAPVGYLAPNAVGNALATIAHIHFSLANSAKSSRQRVADATCAFTDRVHSLARSLGGAVHAFIGDVVVVSWNAASRVIQPEMKAARFLLRLADDTGDAAVTVAGGAFSGQVRVQLSGSAGAQAALTVHARWYGVLNELAAFGRTIGTFVVDNGFKAQIEYGMRLRPIAALCVRDWRESKSSGSNNGPPTEAQPRCSAAATPPPRVLLVSAIVSEVGEGDDEWMYVLAKADGVAPPPPSSALAASATTFAGANASVTATTGLPDQVYGKDELAQLEGQISALAVEASELDPKAMMEPSNPNHSETRTKIATLRDACESTTMSLRQYVQRFMTPNGDGIAATIADLPLMHEPADEHRHHHPPSSPAATAATDARVLTVLATLATTRRCITALQQAANDGSTSLW